MVTLPHVMRLGATTRRALDTLRAAPPIVILAIGWFVLLVYSYPGQMTAHSFDALRQARTPFFSDTSSPAFSTLWRIIEVVIAGPTGMLLVQGALFLTGASAILRRALGPRTAAWGTLAVVVFPPVLAPLAMIVPEAMMAGFLALGTGLLLVGSRRIHLTGLASLTAATAVQLGAAVATLPLVVLLFSWRADARGARRYVTAVAAWISITAAAYGVNTVFEKRETFAWNSVRATHDIVGTLAHVDDEIPDRQLQELLASTGLRHSDHLHTAMRRASPPASSSIADVWSLPPDRSAPRLVQRAALSRAARELALAHPGAYLRHRLAVMHELLWLGARHAETVVPRDLASDSLRLGIPTRTSELQDVHTGIVRALATHTPLFAPWLYLVLALVLLPLARRQRDVAALLASGIGLEISLLVAATTPAFAHSHWLIACTCLATIMIIARRTRA